MFMLCTFYHKKKHLKRSTSMCFKICQLFQQDRLIWNIYSSTYLFYNRISFVFFLHEESFSDFSQPI